MPSAQITNKRFQKLLRTLKTGFKGIMQQSMKLLICKLWAYISVGFCCKVCRSLFSV